MNLVISKPFICVMKNKKPAQAVFYRWRYLAMVVLVAVIVTGLFVHLASLQVLPDGVRGHEFLQKQGLARTLRMQSVPAVRGMITDRFGEPLAVSTPVASLWVNPPEVIANPESWSELARLMGVSEADFEQKLNRFARKEFMYIKRRLAPADAEKWLSKGIDGLYSQEEYRRFYPAGEVTAHLVGFTNVDEQGQEGLELAYEQWLAGQPGQKQVLKDRRQHVIKDIQLIQESKAGNDVALSIDLRLQHLAYKELKSAVKTHQATSGSIVLLDVNTGEVLAMANQPSFNPNDRSGLKLEALRNRAMIDQLEPGSTMKPLTMMAALETGRYHRESEIDANPGFLKVGQKTLLDPVNYGVMDLAKIIQKSSQVGITKISLDLEGDEIRNLFYRVGLGQDTGTGFPGESMGRLPAYENWQPIVQANYAFGYGLTLTPLQLAQAYSVVADSGFKKPVSLLRRDGDAESQSVVSPEVANAIVPMLAKVVEPEGTGTNAALVQYSSAGKTGTTHKVGAQGYADDRYKAIFAGFAPAENPRLVAVVVIDDPKNGQYFGGEVAAPVFANVVEQSLRLMDVAPNAPASQSLALETLKGHREVRALSQLADASEIREGLL